MSYAGGDGGGASKGQVGETRRIWDPRDLSERWYAMSYKFDPYWSYSDVWYGVGTQHDAEEYFRREFGEAWTLTVVDFTGMDEESVNHIKDCGVNFARELD